MKEVIILGMGGTMIKCPYDAETWGVNQVYKMAKKLDKLFITDGRKRMDGSPSWDFDVLNSLDIPIVSLHRYPEIKRLTHFPYDRVVKKFGSEFFTNTICYMIAYALYKNYKKIYFYGVDMGTKMEYVIERGGIEYWIGRAHGMGVETIITKASMLCKNIYGVPYGFKYKVDMKAVDPYKLVAGGMKGMNG